QQQQQPPKPVQQSQPLQQSGLMGMLAGLQQQQQAVQAPTPQPQQQQMNMQSNQLSGLLSLLGGQQQQQQPPQQTQQQNLNAYSGLMNQQNQQQQSNLTGVIAPTAQSVPGYGVNTGVAPGGGGADGNVNDILARLKQIQQLQQPRQ
ncbi:hypothetical protein HDU99_002664, partial [Rhizoclosmatium hyalinum]